MPLYLLASFSCPREHRPSLDGPHPICQHAIQHKVRHARRRRIRLCRVPAEFPIRVEQNARNDDGRVTQGQFHVRRVVVLGEFVGFGQRGQVGCDSVVGCVLQVCSFVLVSKHGPSSTALGEEWMYCTIDGIQRNLLRRGGHCEGFGNLAEAGEDKINATESTSMNLNGVRQFESPSGRVCMLVLRTGQFVRCSQNPGKGRLARMT